MLLFEIPNASEVDDFGIQGLGVDHEVFRLQITVDEPMRVNKLQPLQDLFNYCNDFLFQDHLHALVRWWRPLPLKVIYELSFVELVFSNFEKLGEVDVQVVEDNVELALPKFYLQRFYEVLVLKVFQKMDFSLSEGLFFTLLLSG